MDNADQFRFDQLLAEFIEDKLEGENLVEFIQLVEGNPRFTKELELQLENDHYLEMWSELKKGESTFADKVVSALDEQEDDFAMKIVDFTERNSKQTTSKSIWVNVLAVAACLCLAILYVYERTRSMESVDHGVALISHLEGDLNRGLELGDSVSPGMLHLKTGYLVLTFYDGAKVSVMAPAKLELLDSMTVKCWNGKIKTKVPEVAKGFTVLTPDSKVIDLGTEFGLEVTNQGETKVHVFDGEVETYEAGQPNTKRLITAGQAIKPSKGELTSADESAFTELLRLSRYEKDEKLRKQKAWEKLNLRHLRDPRVLVYYDFENNRQNDVLINKGKIGEKSDAAIVGTKWTNGPWPGKSALDFVRSSDRVRLHVPGEYKKLTLATWVRVDARNPKLSSLMISDGTGNSGIHWQINDLNRVQLGVYHSNGPRETYHANEGFKDSDLGQWVHFTAVVNLKTKKAYQYKNGELLVEKDIESIKELTVKYANIGNWNGRVGNETQNYVRNLNGAMAEFIIFKDSLSQHEIRELALQPDMLHN